MMSDICPYCQLDTAGNHEFNCPNYGYNYVIMGASNQENYILQEKLKRDKALKERDELAARVEALEEELKECLAYFKGEWQSVNNHPASRYRDWVETIEQALGGDDSRS